MINIHLILKNPFSNRWKINVQKHGNLTSTKAWEFNVYNTSAIIGLGLDIDIKKDHAGIRISLSFLMYEIEGHIYDVRHWDYDLNKWSA
jgi:hypothetical protein